MQIKYKEKRREEMIKRKTQLNRKIINANNELFENINKIDRLL